ncbi:superoxide dismutase [uncultured Sphingomonas sp.]|uniref:superoxide dismutase n=1 Tax=uncultured Sphingomonas sp. TaxID=158754 RepID=UPI0025F1668F|nr:superoxide dismutase [uncultured Sphingomonas sp.]
MAFELPPLPFDKSALEPHMSAETFDYHHGKHHQAYVTKVNGWIEEKGLAGLKLTEVVRKATETSDRGLFNNAGQIWNHTFFWQCLAPAGSTRPSQQLQGLIDSGYGSMETFLQKLAEESVNHFASGWGWLVLEGDKLKITSFHDGDSPIAHGVTPLFTLDVWEHAYYIDYRNARPKFVETILANCVNWDFVSQNLDGQGAARADQEQ